LLEDKQELKNSLESSHGVHNNTLDTKEEELVDNERKRVETYMHTITTEELDCNRKRISEVWTFIDRNKEDIQDELELI